MITVRAWRSLALAVVAIALVATTTSRRAGASPLDPSHPVWRGDPVRAESFARALRAERMRRPALHKESSDGLEKAARFGMRLLVVPVLFAGDETPPISREELRDRVFGPGEGTVRGYWDYVSGGRFQLEGVVLPWLRLPNPQGLDYYRNVRDGLFVSAAGPRRMVEDALANAARVDHELLQFDDDGPDGIPDSGDDDGVLDLVLVLHPEVGFEVDPEQSGAAILAVQDRIDSSPSPEPVEVADGIFADVFAVASARGPLGVWVHEMGHLLGLEDLYDVDVTDGLPEAQSRGGLGVWSLMASGTWGGGGDQPSDLDPVSRRLLGWETREVLDTNGAVSLAAVDRDARSSLEVRPEGDWQRERFVLERRVARPQAVVDGGLPGDGVLVYRVDESLRENRGSTGFWIEVLEADGRADLVNLVNDGDATDPFDGVDFHTLGPATTPSTESRLPTTEKIPPLLEISAPAVDGTQRVDVTLAEEPRLRLEAAYFGSGSSVRTHLGFDQQDAWQLRFLDVGSAAPASASLHVESLDPRIEVVSGADVALERQGGTWAPSEDVVVRETGMSGTAGLAPMRLTWELDGDPGTSRSLDLPIPVEVFGGLDAHALDSFAPAVVSAAADTTRFVPLTITELPLPTSSGWGLRTAGTEAYANDVEVTLTSPWFSPPEDGILGFWSKQETETSLPGQVYDAGVCEVYLPDRGWRVLEPTEGPTVRVVQRSEASVRGAVGFGGAFTNWTAYRVQLPRVDVPLRLRFRFASDQSNTAMGWSVAGLQSEILAASAQLSVGRDPGGDLVARATLRGSTAGLVTLLFRYRVPGEQEWKPASSLFPAPSNSEFVVQSLNLPRSVRVAAIALFAEVPEGGGGSTPPLLLGTTGYRAASEIAMPTLLRNPTGRPVIFQLSPLPTDLTMEVFDVRGRRVGAVTIPAGQSWHEWSGVDRHGTRLASGVYFLSVKGHRNLHRRILLLN